MSQKQHSLLVRGMGVFAAALVLMLVIGTFADQQIARAVYAPGNPFVIFVSSLGLITMAYPACFLLGVLAQRSLASKKSQALRIAGAILCLAIALLAGALITKALLSIRDGFGGLTGSELPSPVRMGIGVVAGAGLCALGAKAGKANDAEGLARRVLMVIVALLASYVAIELVKNFMARPRPFTLFSGYDGIEFSPWYSRSSGTAELMVAYDLEKDAFKSFPSGHSVQAASLLATFYGLSLVFPGLQKKLGIAFAAEIIFALAVMACRMILGAHFLSDVSVGALMGVVAFLILLALDNRQPQMRRQESK